MTIPTKPFIRRQELVDWLCDQGFALCDVRKWLAEEIIPRRTFPTKGHAKKKSSPRAYYHVPAVAAALQIDDPLKKL